MTSPLLRRGIMALGGAALAAPALAQSLGNPDRPPQGALNATPQSRSDPGPQTRWLAEQFPSFTSPPATDIGDMPMFWASFNTSPRRIQNGGWARQMTQAQFGISNEIAGVNMRLAAGGIRELHWHLAAEWAYMTYGSCRVTALDPQGRATVQDVKAGDLWYFPAGMPHSLQGLGPDGCEFLIIFDDGNATEYNTLLLSDWIAHTPPEVLALNFGVPVEAFERIPTSDLWIFQGELPGPLAQDQAAVADAGTPANPQTFSLDGSAPVKQTRSGVLRMADSTNFKASTTIAAAVETVKPGAMREMHWHPNADEWQYWIAGRGRMTVFNAGPRAVTADFQPGDVGYVKKSHGHYVQNTGDTDLTFLAVFRAPEYQEVSLTHWLTHTPPALVAQHLNIDPAVIARFPRNSPGIVPA